MLSSKKKATKKQDSGNKRKYLFPAVFLLLSFLLMILPLEGVVSSVKAVLSYIFIPQIRLAHGTAKYAENVHQTVRELLNAHHENALLKHELEINKLQAMQAETVFAENERLTQA
jgi:rod shape-determining protein MreC